MTAPRRIESVTFRATGERRPPLPGEWFSDFCQGMFAKAIGGCHIGDRDIFTRHEKYAEPEPEPDLREMVNTNVSDPGTQYALGCVIDRLNAQKDEIEGLRIGALLRDHLQQRAIEVLQNRTDALDGKR